MPIQNCTEGGRPGYKWGSKGKCYTYDPNSKISKERARSKAAAQGRAIHVSKNKG